VSSWSMVPVEIIVGIRDANMRYASISFGHANATRETNGKKARIHAGCGDTNAKVGDGRNTLKVGICTVAYAIRRMAA
jgi:hypothetical protein